MRKIMAIGLVVGLLLAAVLSAGAAFGTEGNALTSVAKAPRWAPGDKWTWKMDKTVTYSTGMTDVNGTLYLNFTEDDQVISDTVAAIDGQKYRMTFTEFEWLNGTYHFDVSVAGETNGWVESNGSVAATFSKTGVRYRNLSDFSLVNATVAMAYRYGCIRTDGNYRLFNWSGNETHTLTTDVALNSLKFPLDLSAAWNVDSNITDSYSGTKEWPEYPAWGTRAYTGTRWDDYTFTVTVAASMTTKSAAGVTFDCFELADSGVDNWGWTEGAASSSGTSPFVQTRWWSLLAGTTVNTNETTKLESYTHIANLKPTLATIPLQTAYEETPFTLDLAPFAFDADLQNDTGDFLTFNATCAPFITGFAVNVTSGKISVTPTQDHLGSHQITVSVTDAFNEKATGTFVLFVVNVNDAPYVADPMANVTIYENDTLVTSVYLNTVFADFDPTSVDSLNYSVSGNGSIAVTIDVDTRVTLRSSDLFAPATPVVLTFTATDTGSGNDSTKMSVSSTLNVTVVHKNHRPVPKPIAEITMNEDGVYTTLDLADFFTDVDVAYAGDELNYSFFGNKSIVVGLAGSKVTLTPAANWNGKEVITFTCSDGVGLPVNNLCNVTVTAVNDPPVIQNTTTPSVTDVTLAEALNGTLTDQKFVLNATDADSDTLNVTWTVLDATGKKVAEVKAVTTYILRCSYLGDLSAAGSPYKVRAFITDGKENATKEWNVIVTNVNRNPVAAIAAPKNATKIVEKKALTLDATGTKDDDQNASTLKYVWTSSIQGKLGENATLILKNLKKGKHVITLTVTDTEGAVASQSVTVTVTAQAAGAGKVIPGFGMMLGVVSLALVGALLSRRKK